MNNDGTDAIEVAVIGAGLAGMTAAIEAATNGRAVTVFEARGRPGGRAGTREIKGFLINQGAHALYVDGAAMAFLRKLGREPRGGVPDVPGGLGIDGEVDGVRPANLGSLSRTPLQRLAQLDPGRFDKVTVAAAIEEVLGRGAEAQVALAQIRLSTYGHDPQRASAGAALRQLMMAGGVRYLDGGWQTIVDDLREEAEARGVRVRAGAKISRMEASADGLVLDGRIQCGSVVIAAGGPEAVNRLLPHDPESARWVEAARPATLACLDVGLGCPWGDGPAFALGIDQPLYLSVHAPVADLAPEGQSLVHVMRYHHPDEAADADADLAACEAMLDRVRPGWRHDVVHQRFNRRFIAAHDQPQAASGGLAGRPGVASLGTDGVFIAGDWVGPEGLLADAAVASGRSAGVAAAASLVAREVATE